MECSCKFYLTPRWMEMCLVTEENIKVSCPCPEAISIAVSHHWQKKLLLFFLFLLLLTFRGACTCSWGCDEVQNLMFCLATCPFQWKCASSHSREAYQNQLFWSRGNFHSCTPHLAEGVVYSTLWGACTLLTRLCWGPEPDVLLSNMPVHVETCLVTEKNAVETAVVLDLFADTLAKVTALILVSLDLSLRNLHFVWKQFQVTMNDPHHRTPGNPHFLWQPSGGISWRLFQTSPNVLNACWCSGSPMCITVSLVVGLCHTASISFCISFWWCCNVGFPPWEFAAKLPLDKNDWFCSKIKLNFFLVRSWNENCFSASVVASEAIVATLYVSPENEIKILTSWEYINIYIIQAFKKCQLFSDHPVISHLNIPDSLYHTHFTQCVSLP